jgi:1,4-dihydroxy-2-naphthoyl-CoA hydrolase
VGEAAWGKQGLKGGPDAGGETPHGGWGFCGFQRRPNGLSCGSLRVWGARTAIGEPPLVEDGTLQSDGDVRDSASQERAQQRAHEPAPGRSAPEARAASGSAPYTAGWFAQIGLEILSASATEVLAEWTVGPRHLQPHGIVHGGVYASVVESCCSVGAVLAAPAGKQVVGVENHTSFLRPVREGRLRARAVPLHAGRQAQLWECTISDQSERLIATGRVRLFCVDPPAAAQAGGPSTGQPSTGQPSTGQPSTGQPPTGQSAG